MIGRLFKVEIKVGVILKRVGGDVRRSIFEER